MSKAYPKYSKYGTQKDKKQSYYDRLTNFLRNSKRIIKIANKPSREEYWMIFKIVAIGMVVLGVLSYVIQLIFSVVLPIGA